MSELMRLESAGFSPREIRDHFAQEAEQLRSAGFSDAEIQTHQMGTETDIPAPVLPPETQANIQFGREGETTSPLLRAGAGLKASETGQINFLRSMFGDENVGQTQSGEILVRDDAQQPWRLFRAPEMSGSGGAAETMPRALIEAGPMFIPGLNVATVPAAGLSAAGGNVLRQFTGAMLPGEEAVSLPERAVEAATAGTLGAGIQGGVNVVGRGIQAVSPRNVAARAVSRAEAQPFAREGRRLAQTGGVTFTPGQETGSRSILTMEGLLRRHPRSADAMSAFDEQQLRQATVALDRTLNRIARGRLPMERAGDVVRQSFNRTMRAAVKARRNNARSAFGAAERAMGNQSVIQTSNTAAALDDLISRFNVPGGGDASAALVSRLRNVRQQLTGKHRGPAVRMLPVRQMQRLLEVYGGGAAGTGKPFKDLDTAQTRLISREIFRALQRDLDQAVDDAGIGAEAASALRTARDQYRADSALLNTLEDSALGRVLGNPDIAPEVIAQRLSQMPGSSARATIRLLQEMNPDAARAAQSAMVEDVLIKAGLPRSMNAPAPTMASGGEAFSPQRFVTEIRKSPIWDTLDDGQRQALGDVLAIFERVANRAGTEGSPTAPLLFAMDMAKALGTGIVDVNPLEIGRSMATLFAPSRLARIVTTPEGRTALRTVRTATPGSRRMIAALTFLSTRIGGPEDEQGTPMQAPQ